MKSDELYSGIVSGREITVELHVPKHQEHQFCSYSEPWGNTLMEQFCK